MATPGHKSSRSMSVTTAQQMPNGPFTQRKLTSQSTTSLALPEKASPLGRPPSPLRNEFLPNTFTGVDHDGGRSEDGSDDEDDDNRWMRSPSPTSSSVSQFAANFTSRLGNWMSPARPAFNSLPTDAELEAEAERERERSRREAERILTEEAAGRRALEDRLLETTRMLPPPPIRSQTMPNPGPPSPASSSQKDGIWSAVKNKLTPTKDPLTPAQQVMQDAKAREKKPGKGKDREWPAKGHNKYNDPAFLSLNNPPVTPPRRPLSSPNVSPTPSRPTTTIPPPNLSPTPGRGSGEHRASDSLMTSPATTNNNSTPVYAQFDGQGTLDVHGTLLTIARRFEKLEKWTVGHVRALEDRMSDVERWLVDKEKEKDEDTHPNGDNTRDIADIRDELGEVQSRVGELGREMAKIVTAPGNLSNGPSRGSAEITTPLIPQTTSSIAPLIPQMTSSSSQHTPVHPRYQSQHATISPPLGSSRPSSSRLPYPTGDYASPPSTMMNLPSESFSPPVSPPRSRPGSVTGRNSTGGGRSSISGLPATTGTIPSMHSVATGNGSAGYGNGGSGGNNNNSNGGGSAGGGVSGLPAPSSSSVSRPASVSPQPVAVSPQPVSPTPMARKRYTVALGGPLVAPPDEEQQTLGRAYFSASPGGLDESEYEDEDEEDGEDQQETIGKRASARVVGATYAHGHAHSQSISGTASLEASPGDRRARAQSTYGFGALQTPTRPLVPRSKSTDRASLDRTFSSNSANSASSGAAGANGFVDPYRLRQESLKEERLAQPKPLAHGKVPIGQLVAFFDKDKKR